MEAEASSTPGNAKTTVDGKLWQTFNKSFSKVQNILDENRVLIGEINQNHESKAPEDLTRNVALIKELNINIAQVVNLYANLSTSLVKSMDNPAEEESDGDGQQADEGTGAKTLGSPLLGQKRGRTT